jgi:thioredoxin 1
MVWIGFTLRDDPEACPLRLGENEGFFHARPVSFRCYYFPRHVRYLKIVTEPELTLLDQFDFHHRISDTRGTALVIFTGPACGCCIAWKRLLHDYATRASGTRVFEVDAERDLALAREFDVFHLPTIFLFRDGEFHGELQCEAGLAAVQSAIRSLLNQEPQELP